jgi:hypothetical protein
MTPAETAARYGLIRPGMGDALVAVHRANGAKAAQVWAQLLAAAGLAGHETDDAALHRMIGAMAAADPLTRISARALKVRLNTHAHVSAPPLTAAPSTAGSLA